MKSIPYRFLTPAEQAAKANPKKRAPRGAVEKELLSLRAAYLALGSAYEGRKKRGRRLALLAFLLGAAAGAVAAAYLLR